MLGLWRHQSRRHAAERRVEQLLTSDTGTRQGPLAAEAGVRTLHRFGNGRIASRWSRSPGESAAAITPTLANRPEHQMLRQDEPHSLRNMARWWGLGIDPPKAVTPESETPSLARLDFYCQLSEPLLRLFTQCRLEVIRRGEEHSQAVRQRVEYELQEVEARRGCSVLLEMHMARRRFPENPENLLILGLLGLAPECDPTQPPRFASADPPTPGLSPPSPSEARASEARASEPDPDRLPAERVDRPEPPAAAPAPGLRSTPEASEPVAVLQDGPSAEDLPSPAMPVLDRLKAARRRQERLEAQMVARRQTRALAGSP